MKNRILLVALLLAGSLSFMACDPEEIITNIANNTLGNATLTISDPNQATFYAGTDTLKFTSSVADTWSQNGNSCALSLSANINLLKIDSLSYPYLGVQVNDTVARIYELDNSLDSIEQVMNMNLGNLLTEINGKNVFVLAASDTCWYLSKSGVVEVTNFPGYGYEITGTLTNVQAYYITQSTIDYVEDLINKASGGDFEAIQTLMQIKQDPTTILPVVTFNGNISSRRFNISAIVKLLQDNAAE